MTPNEFKAWFDGFTEAFSDDAPTYKQWGRIKARVAEIDGKAVTQTVYLDHYWPTYVRTYPQALPNWATTYCGAATGQASGATLTAGSNAMMQNAGYASTFNSSQAMHDLGRAEGKSFS